MIWVRVFLGWILVVGVATAVSVFGAPRVRVLDGREFGRLHRRSVEIPVKLMGKLTDREIRSYAEYLSGPEAENNGFFAEMNTHFLITLMGSFDERYSEKERSIFRDFRYLYASRIHPQWPGVAWVGFFRRSDIRTLGLDIRRELIGLGLQAPVLGKRAVNLTEPGHWQWIVRLFPAVGFREKIRVREALHSDYTDTETHVVSMLETEARLRAAVAGVEAEPGVRFYIQTNPPGVNTHRILTEVFFRAEIKGARGSVLRAVRITPMCQVEFSDFTAQGPNRSNARILITEAREHYLCQLMAEVRLR